MRTLAYLLALAIFIAIAAYCLAARPDPTPLFEQVQDSQSIGAVW